MSFTACLPYGITAPRLPGGSLGPGGLLDSGFYRNDEMRQCTFSGDSFITLRHFCISAKKYSRLPGGPMNTGSRDVRLISYTGAIYRSEKDFSMQQESIAGS